MSLRVMIIDDNNDFLRVARCLLEREGITVVSVASSTAEALRSAEEHNPDVILVDVELGEESGFSLAKRLSPTTGDGRPVVLISANCEEDLRDLIEDSPAVGFVSKTRLSASAVVELLNCGDERPSSD